MEITIETTDQDHLSFYKDYGFKRNWLQLAIILLSVDLLLSYLLSLPFSYFTNVLIIGIILFPISFIIRYSLAKSRLKTSYDNLLLPNTPKTFKPFAVGIEITEDDSNTFLRYEAIKQAGEAGKFIFIISSDGMYYLLPNWCFSSDNEANHFLRIVKNGIANAKGIKPATPLTFKPVYLIGLLCLIPLIGAIIGVVLIILGLVHYKDKVFVIIGALGILITVVTYGSLIYSTENSDAFSDGFADMAQSGVNDLVKNIEFYKLQNGVYPDSLQQVDTKNSFIQITDPLQSYKKNKKYTLYQYQKKGSKYLLYSVGKDGMPDTRDDIYPTLSNADTSKLGFVRK